VCVCMSAFVLYNCQNNRRAVGVGGGGGGRDHHLII